MASLNNQDDVNVSHVNNLRNKKFNKLIGNLHMQHASKYRLSVPLSRLVPLPLVRPRLRLMSNHLKITLSINIMEVIEYYVFPK